LFFSIVFTITVITAISIGVFNLKKNTNALLISSFILILSLYSITHYLVLIEPSVFWAAILYINFTPLYLLLGPLLYFYIRNSTSFSSGYQKRDWIHFIPAIIEFIGISSYIFSSFEYKTTSIQNLFNDYESFKNMDFHLIYKPSISFVIRIGSLLSYTIYSLLILKKFYNTKSSVDQINKQKRISIIWLFIFLVFVIITTISYTLFTLNIFSNIIFSNFNEVVISISGLSITLMALSLLLIPSISKNISKLAYKEIDQEKLITENPYFHELKDQIDNYFIKNKPCLEKKFTRIDLARALDVPEHHITHCFTYIFKQSYPAYKNSQKVEFLKEILDSAESNLKIDNLYTKVGFTSKSSMYTSFKEFVGMTPNQYLKEVLKSKNVK